jgi:carbonic anhydrase/acetyltransferase-like protein (isoleucine patch superfamily)
MDNMIKTINGITPQVSKSAFVSEAAYVVGDVVIGEGSSIWPGTVIRGDTGRISIGKNSSV